MLATSLAWALNLRTEVAQVGVSTLGKMFSTLRLPAKSFSDLSARPSPTREKAGAWAPAFGSSPLT
ncbi:hypothetical protein D3C73_1396460 [compost metagenome]